MPELSFVLPHWLYWSGLILFPLITLLLYRRSRQHPTSSGLSLPLAYGLLVVGGFIGIHRLYLGKWLTGGLWLLLALGTLLSFPPFALVFGLFWLYDLCTLNEQVDMLNREVREAWAT